MDKLKTDTFEYDRIIDEATVKHAEELKKAIDQELLKVMMERVQQEEVKKLVDSDDELPDWAIEYLADRI